MSEKQCEYFKLPQRFRKDVFLNSFGYACYRLLYIDADTINLDDVKKIQRDGVSTRFKMTKEEFKEFEELRTLLNASKIDTALAVVLHIESNPNIYIQHGVKNNELEQA